MKEWLYSIGVGPFEILCFGPIAITGAIILIIHFIIEYATKHERTRHKGI